MWGPARVRRRVCLATRARRATASAVAWPMAVVCVVVEKFLSHQFHLFEPPILCGVF